MSGRTLAGLFLLVAGLGAWLLLGGNEQEDVEPGLDLAALLPAELRRITVEAPGEDPVDIVRAGGGWSVNGYPARDSLLDAMLSGVRSVEPLRLIARSESTHERMKVSDSTAVRVRFIEPAGEDGVTILVGAEGRDGRFVRVAGDVRAYVVPAGLLDAIVEPDGELRDFTILRADTAAIRRILIRRGTDVRADLQRTASGWRVGGAPADGEKVRVYLETITDLQASGFPADTFVFAADFERPDATVEIYAETAAALGPTVSLLFATALDHPHVLVRRGDSPIVYALDRLRATFLTSSARTLAASP